MSTRPRESLQWLASRFVKSSFMSASMAIHGNPLHLNLAAFTTHAPDQALHANGPGRPSLMLSQHAGEPAVIRALLMEVTCCES
jgi:hypothetical protein